MTQADDVMIAKLSEGNTDASQAQVVIQAKIPQLAAWLTGIDLPDDDKALILAALKRLRNVASQHVYGGMGHDYILAKAALEALEKMTE